MDDFSVMDLASLAEMNYLRLEAMDLFERCLTEGNPGYLETFIEEQISCDPPRLEVLREVTDDLHQRLLSLREYYMDVVQRAWMTLRDDFGVSSPNPFEHHRQLSAPELIDQLQHDNPDLTAEETVLLVKMLDTSLSTSSQLRGDIHLTEQLYAYVLDWVDGLNATFAKRYWADGRSDKYMHGIQ
ncbi:MAG: hypothetical protein K8L99_36275 [Anaerolineae bacterium]|nr:hypothetical protein [Anaerolineae bacterium]